MEKPDIPTVNDELARKFCRVEARLDGSRSAVELFEELLTGVETQFAIPFAWLSLIRRPETAALRASLEVSPFLAGRLNDIAEAPFQEVVPDCAAPLLANGDLRRYFRLLPPSRKYFIRSLAVSPLTPGGTTIGSINLGDASPARYEPGMDTALLTHLAGCVSAHLFRLRSPGNKNARSPW
ncbi:MAG: hypothetical protein ACYC7J_11815 [Syntrophales bacterium]